MPVFTTGAELKYYVENQLQLAVENTVEKLNEIVEKFMIEFYADYEPNTYDRTYQLRDCIRCEISLDGLSGVVYLDYGTLEYLTGFQPSGWQVVDASSRGEHGATGLHIENGSGVKTWDQPYLDNKAKEILISRIKAAGIPIR